MTIEIQKMGIHLGDGDKRGGGIQGDLIMHSGKAKHGCAVHSYTIASGHV